MEPQLFVILLIQIKDNLNNLKNSFSKIKPLICYAMKANFNKGIIKIMSKNNLGVDVVSKGELKESLKCGVKNKKLYFQELERLMKK